MLTDDERREIEAEMTRYPTRQAVCVDAMKIVQRHRGWVSDESLHDIETLIAHFLSVSWGPVIPAGETHVGIEATKGNNGYYLTSDGNTMPYRVRIRTPSFAHMQMVPLLSRGRMIPDLLAILGSLDYVLADVDR